TLGYGDILPKNPFAMTLANAEALVGQIYPAVVIAKLVSLYEHK
ncbi:MAG: ion channel, partial [Crocosphaera sp.]